MNTHTAISDDKLKQFTAAMSVVEGDDADAYAKKREGCLGLVGRIEKVYDSAVDYNVGNAKSAELEIEAIPPYGRNYELLYSIDLALDSPLMDFADWPGNPPDGSGEQFESGEIDTSLLDALWPSARSTD
jgi:hypothetical protein